MLNNITSKKTLKRGVTKLLQQLKEPEIMRNKEKITIQQTYKIGIFTLPNCLLCSKKYKTYMQHLATYDALSTFKDSISKYWEARRKTT